MKIEVEIKKDEEAERLLFEKFEKRIAKTYSTKGHKKLWQYFLNLFKSDYFQNKIKEWRQWYQIPPNGFKDSQQIFPYPESWKLRYTDSAKKLDSEIDAMCRKFHLHPLYWDDPIRSYLFYNQLEFGHDTDGHNLCQIFDVVELKKEPFEDSTNEMDDLIFPIAIRISPYATNNDIVDYVRKMADVIDDFQSSYRKPEIKIGKIKTKKAQDRDEFIYQNQDKTGKEIARLVKEKFGGKLLNYEYIPKIIFREKQKRQKV